VSDTPLPRAEAAGSYARWVPAAIRVLLQVFFRRVEVVGEGRVPRSAPLLYAANHNNGLIDPLLVMGYLPRRPRFLAKATLWGHALARPFLALGHLIPVYRRQDPGFEPERNLETFARCEEVLAAGGAVALFPEGKSHASPGLAELRSGAARIAVGAERRFGKLGVRIVPVGLIYDAPGRFRSQVLVKVGEPFSPEREAEEGGQEEIRRVTRRLTEGLREVTLSYPSWEEARLLERAVDLYLHPEPDLPVAAPLPERFAVLRAFLEGYRRLREERPEQLAPLAAALARYDTVLRACRLRDLQVGARYPFGRVLAFLLQSLLVLLVLLPLAAVGVVLNGIPYRVCGWLGARVAQTPDLPATHMLIGGAVLFPITWAFWMVLAGWRWGAPASLAIALMAPLGGYAAIRFRDRLLVLFSEARAYLVLRSSDLKQRLDARRRDLRRELLRLVEELREGRGGEPG
jgi:glycerol-3-phosphate O-acyltransferase / dihydroxyacetone phosphate acyltransferase